MAKEFDLVPVLEEGTKRYQVKDFDEVLEACKGFISDQLDSLILDGDIRQVSYAEIKKARTSIRNKKALIESARKNLMKLALTEFETQMKTLEILLSETDDQLKEIVDKYDTEVLGKTKAPSKITLTIKGYDVQVIEKIKKYAEKVGSVEITIK